MASLNVVSRVGQAPCTLSSNTSSKSARSAKNKKIKKMNFLIFKKISKISILIFAVSRTQTGTLCPLYKPKIPMETDRQQKNSKKFWCRAFILLHRDFWPADINTKIYFSVFCLAILHFVSFLDTRLNHILNLLVRFGIHFGLIVIV